MFKTKGGFVYIMTNRHHTVLYTGVTRDLIRRIHALAALAERPIMAPAEFGALGFYNSKRPRQ